MISTNINSKQKDIQRKSSSLSLFAIPFIFVLSPSLNLVQAAH